MHVIGEAAKIWVYLEVFKMFFTLLLIMCVIGYLLWVNYEK